MRGIQTADQVHVHPGEDNQMTSIQTTDLYALEMDVENGIG